MSEHLPECGYSPGQPGFGGINSGIPSTQPYLAPSPCICDRLRACEQRVLKENFCALSYNHALDSAREAVKMIHGSDMGVFDATAWIMKSAAIKAIDALRNNI